ncbi:MAG: methylated-DNA--[protein]-cysteine S-methyltransferase [Pseudomonadota bacterium]
MTEQANNPRYSLLTDSPVGTLVLTATDEAITSVTWVREGETVEENPNDLLREAARQIAAYFEKGEPFALPLEPAGSAFQRKGWKAMAEIPYGETESYGTLATRIGSGPRAVGMLCATNPIPIIVPCHRVVAAGGKLGGFSGGEGLPTKKWLLGHEGVLEPTLL